MVVCQPQWRVHLRWLTSVDLWLHSPHGNHHGEVENLEHALRSQWEVGKLALEPMRFYQFLFAPTYRPLSASKPHYVLPQNAFARSEGQWLFDETENWQETALPEKTWFFLLSEKPVFMIGRSGTVTIALKCIYLESIVYVAVGSILDDEGRANYYIGEARELAE